MGEKKEPITPSIFDGRKRRYSNLADLPETLEPEYLGPWDTIGVVPITLTPASFTRSVFCLENGCFRT